MSLTPTASTYGRPKLAPGREDCSTWKVRVPPALDEQARAVAVERGISLSQLVRESVTSHTSAYTKNENQVPSIKQANLNQLPSNETFKMVSLFTGAGGLDVGLSRTGAFDLLAAVELEEKFCATLRENRDNNRFGTRETKVIQADLSHYSPEELMREINVKPGEVDVLVGGPPCQTWSTAGRRAGKEDPRGQLIWSFLRFVEALRPKVFLMENVRGLFSAALEHRPIADRPANGGSPLRQSEEPGSAFRLWVNDALSISNSEYRIDSFEVNAVNYGAPQLRERVLIFGNRLGKLTAGLEPTHSQNDPNLKEFSTLRDAIGSFREEDPVLLDFSPRKKSFLHFVPMGGNWRSMPDDIARTSMGRAYFAKGGRSGWWRRLSWDLPSPTITTMPNHSSTSMCHPDETRVLSVAECAKVQEFPDGWTFVGSVAEQMKQVGNAVPARLGEVAGESIINILTNERNLADSDIPRYTNTYMKSHVRTRSWWKDGRAVVLSDASPVSR